MPPLALVVLAVQAAGAASGIVPRPGTLPLRCGAIRIATPDGASPTDRTFSSREIPDLLLHPRVRRNLRGEHLMQLKVFTPSGFLYQVITVPFVGTTRPPARVHPKWIANDAPAQAEDAPPPRDVPGFPRPLEVQRLQPAPDGSGRGREYELRARLPVAGTSITLSSLYGIWSAQPYLDGQAEPCGPATTFTIRE